ncbi:Neuroligin-3 [Portunus trituberculatus]|uniref:Neuroligin-3 n=1 Tax=Portunus trituberculatus TaxID=210409 RepID=A0A5B7EGK2_PORTR|nr:Neuroligin-3 [Portunus trituberculatus]
MAEALDCPPSDVRDGLITCLRRKSVRELLSVNLQTKPFYTPLGPVVDGVIIKKDPLKSMREDTGIFGKFDLMYGVTRAESFHMLGDADSKNGFSVHRRNHLVNAYVSNNYENFVSLGAAALSPFSPLRGWREADRAGGRDKG